ncbi:glycine betaine ABC transporter substrate-binding protein [Mycobacterium vicinigordonae]|uniref:ABC-type glycine betaine transport system substrate-binding domain-containing protein n=1 Tax=Mycobacterium vicinigordonae TaxID=1719132 RepID=A0A7D6E1B9_9MYCO|nr:glycine betaine ABC transporter substrate-binding protein [Mycobacterium vicinigordonae]QLL06226.1 hypothetical protein H0P51_21010 [Mycobacterium vicinigordonae]
MSVGRPAALLLALMLALVGCSGGTGNRDLVVGSRPDGDSKLLAAIYVAALRSYGFAAHSESAEDPMGKLDSAAFVVVPGYTGRVLQTLQPGAVGQPGPTAHPGAADRSDDSPNADAPVYRAMNAALPEGIAAGDYATAAEDKPVLIVTGATAAAWGGNDLSLLLGHCDGLRIGSVAGRRPPMTVGPCRLPAAREFADDATMFAALRAGELTAAWATTADPGVPADLVALADGKPALIQAENVVPLYRRNVLSTRQLLAINEVAGVLDTEALAEMRRKVAAGANPQVVADAWLGEHPLGR